MGRTGLCTPAIVAAGAPVWQLPWEPNNADPIGHPILDIALPFLCYKGQISKAASETKPLIQTPFELNRPWQAIYNLSLAAKGAGLFCGLKRPTSCLFLACCRPGEC